jgi:hypothetical protein
LCRFRLGRTSSRTIQSRWDLHTHERINDCLFSRIWFDWSY